MVYHIVLEKDISEQEAKVQLKKSKDNKYFRQFYEENIALTKKQLSASVSADQLIVQTTHHIEELSRVMNTIAKRLREWYAWYNPEAEHAYPVHEEFVQIVLTQKKEQLIKKLNVKQEMGANFDKKDIEAMLRAALLFQELEKTRKEQEKYLSSLLKQQCPNITALVGEPLAAKLLTIAGSLRRLMLMPASTIQLLGAEKALFRHLCSNASPPKHGVLLQHPLLQKAAMQDRGKRARLLADKVSIASRVDFFKGAFVGDKLINEVEKKCK